MATVSASAAARRIQSQNLIRKAQIDVNNTIMRATVDLIRRQTVVAIRQGNNQVADMLVKYLETMSNSYNDVRRGIIADSNRIAEAMKDSVLDAFNRTRIRSVDPRTQNRLHGLLRPALDSVFKGTLDGILIDFNAINVEARHWKRLNFGVGANAGPAFPLSIPGLQRTPEPGEMLLPAGTWLLAGSRPWGSGRDDWFRPRGRVPFIATRGIRGQHFLEVGILQGEQMFQATVRDRIEKWAQQISRTG